MDQNSCEICQADHVDEVIGDSGRVVIPNIFSADIDGINDIFLISLYLPHDSLDSYFLRITSRSGKVIFSSQDPNEMFRGRDSNGNPLRPQVLDYALEITVAGVQYSFRGEVAVVRFSRLNDRDGNANCRTEHCDNCVWPDQIDPKRGAIYPTNQPIDDLCL